MAAAGQLLSRSELIKALGISDSSERRRRRNDPMWVPHLVIGTKVYYRPQSVEHWLGCREATCSGDGDASQPC